MDESESDPEDSSAEIPSLQGFFRRLFEDAKEYTRQRPLEGLMGAFLAGLLLSLFLRRDR